jgi:hypothetical protein
VTATRDGSAGGASPGTPGPGRFTQVQVIGDAAVAVTADRLEPGPGPVLAAPDGPDPAGRARVIGQAAAELANGMSVQLYGPPGAGQNAVARAVIRRMAAGPGPVAGVELRPAADCPHTLEGLYERLALAFFRGLTVGPPEGPLRAAVTAAGLSAVIVLGDCDLAAPDLARLLETFGGCAFLLTSRYRTLYRSGATHEIGPGPRAVTTAGAQAAALAAGLPEDGRRALAALATFDAEIPAGCLAAVTGPAAAGAGAGLLAAGLVTEGAGGYRITPGAAAAVARAGWTPASPAIAGRGLLEYLAGAGTPPPGPGLLVSVASRLHQAGEDLLATRLIRAALPDVLRAGHVRGWMRLVGLGLQAAGAAGASADLAYFAQEDSVRRVLLGEVSTDPVTIAAAAVTAAGPDGTARRPGRRRAARYGALVGAALALTAAVVAVLVAVLARAGSPDRATGGTSASERPASAAASVRAAPASHPAARPRPAPRPPSPSPRHSVPPSSPAPSPRPSSRPPDPSPSASPATPAAVVRAYVAAINARDYAAAWNLGGDHLSPSFAQFVAGFAGTAQDSVTIIAATGSSVLVNLTAVQTDGSRDLYAGIYVVRDGVITASALQRLG